MAPQPRGWGKVESLIFVQNGRTTHQIGASGGQSREGDGTNRDNSNTHGMSPGQGRRFLCVVELSAPSLPCWAWSLKGPARCHQDPTPYFSSLFPLGCLVLVPHFPTGSRSPLSCLHNHSRGTEGMFHTRALVDGPLLQVTLAGSEFQ